MPIRWRLSLWFSLILFIILLISGVTLYFVLQNYLINQIDESLASYSNNIHAAIEPLESQQNLDYATIHQLLPPINEFASPGLYIQIVDNNGTVLVKSDNLTNLELPVSPALLAQGFAGNSAIQTVSAGNGVDVRIMASPLKFQGQELLIEVAQSVSHLNTTMSKVTGSLAISSLLALLLATISGSMIVRSALSPVSRIARTAKQIETSFDLNSRVKYRGANDEIRELAVTFDSLIERLQEVFKSQKEFVEDASHELRGPLTVIKGNLDLMKRNLGAEDRKESIRAIEAETSRMAKIANDLLLLAEVESRRTFQPEPVKLTDILLSETGRARGIAGTRSIFIGREEDLTVMGDAQMLRQLMSNLINNAIHYTPENGTIILSLFRDDGWACLQVSDTGVGIPPEHLPHIFDRFYRADKSRSRAKGGTGLGLSIVRGIAEKHGGKITVSSENGKGSTFTAYLKI